MIPMERVGAQERRVLKLLRALSERERETLMAFAEFLAARAGSADETPIADAPAVTRLTEPAHEPRPAEETVIAAIKRLRRVYPMLEPGEMLNETSALMAAHVLQGRAANQVIDELERLFIARYEAKRSP
jgi:hypothetical protein